MTTFNPADLRKLIQNTLKPMGLWTADVEELLLATCAQESAFGTYRKQIHGPALGIFQMEPEDFSDIWQNFLKYHPQISSEIHALSTYNTADDLVNNDPYAIAMCRAQYLRAPEAIPPNTDLSAIWALYKKRYNTPEGAATQEQFFHNYKRYVTDGTAS